MRISDWSSDVCSSDLVGQIVKVAGDKVAVAIDGNGLVVPKAAFLKGKKGPALKAPKAKILAVLKEAEADAAAVDGALKPGAEVRSRSEEHTSELQSLMRISYAVFCLKKKTPHNVCTKEKT